MKGILYYILHALIEKNMIEYLLNHGAKITDKNKRGKTILYSSYMAREKYEDSLIFLMLNAYLYIYLFLFIFYLHKHFILNIWQN